MTDDTDTVLVRAKNKTDCISYHLADSEHPDRPRCSHGQRDTEWDRYDPSRLPDRMSLCKRCDPDHTVERKHFGDSLAAKLADADSVREALQ